MAAEEEEGGVLTLKVDAPAAAAAPEGDGVSALLLLRAGDEVAIPFKKINKRN